MALFSEGWHRSLSGRTQRVQGPRPPDGVGALSRLGTACVHSHSHPNRPPAADQRIPPPLAPSGDDGNTHEPPSEGNMLPTWKQGPQPNRRRPSAERWRDVIRLGPYALLTNAVAAVGVRAYLSPTTRTAGDRRWGTSAPAPPKLHAVCSHPAERQPRGVSEVGQKMEARQSCGLSPCSVTRRAAREGAPPPGFDRSLCRTPFQRCRGRQCEDRRDGF